MLTHIDFHDIYFLTGLRSKGLRMPLRELTGALPENVDQCVVVLTWPAEWSFFKCLLKWKHDDHEGRFVSTPADVKKLLERCGIGAEGHNREVEEGTRRALAGQIPSGAEATFSIGIDTDNPDLPAILENAERDDHGLAFLNLYLEVYPVGGARGARALHERPLPVFPTPAQHMQKFEGYIAIDLGNTNSTLVSLPRHEIRSDEIEVVKVERSEDGRLVPTIVFIEKFDPVPPSEAESRPIPAAVWQFGLKARDSEVGGWPVPGAKRLLADPDWQVPHMVWLKNRRVDIPKRAPAELFLCSLFKSFCQSKQRIPRQIAITYPSTFSRRESDALKQSVFDAWYRALAQTHYKHDKKATDKLIPVVIDEATAAALYFLYRDFIEAPGRMDVLRYLYPRELNLLLYDCGGGTTDIALVQAKCLVDRTIRIEVLGRTGHRSFAGDDITVAVFKLLKAKLAIALQGQSRSSAADRLTLPSDVAEYPTWLTRHERLINRLVPTQFKDEMKDLEQEHVRDRMLATKDFWKHAELFKKDFGVDVAKPIKRAANLASDGAFCKLMKKHYPAIETDRLLTSIANLEIRREEVDAIVRAAVDQTISNANDMIRSKLPPDSEIHWVYVVGNASRYPFIQQRLREKLLVRFLDGAAASERATPDGKAAGGLPAISRLRFDLDNLKNAVAKGAVLALTLQIGNLGVDLQFDTHLIDRLPFDITYYDYNHGGHPLLYTEHERYQDLPIRNIPAPPVNQNGSVVDLGPSESGIENRRTEIYLGRRWPGESEPSPFLHFHFDHPVSSPTLQVRYDTERDPPCFLMRDEFTGEEVEGQELAAAAYLAPIQSGTL